MEVAQQPKKTRIKMKNNKNVFKDREERRKQLMEDKTQVWRI